MAFKAFKDYIKSTSEGGRSKAMKKLYRRPAVKESRWEDEQPHHHVDHWYDRHTRSWVVQRKDKEGNQVGTADYVHSRKEAESLRKYHEKKNIK